MLTQSSPELMLTTWSDMIARPMCVPTWRTPGIARNSAIACEAMRSSPAEMCPGAPSTLTSRSRSWNVGAIDDAQLGYRRDREDQERRRRRRTPGRAPECFARTS